MQRDTSNRRYGVVELFAGAGGLASGFIKSCAFEIIALTDNSQNARETFIHNFPGHTYIHEDVVNLEPTRLQQAADGRTIHGILGGPPCQGFSLAGRKDRDDHRNKYITEYAKFVDALQPQFLLMENVPQVLRHERFMRLIEHLSLNYNVLYAVLNAARYGVPQTRHRAFVLAYRRDLGITPTFPTPTHGFVGRPVYNYQSNRLELPCIDGVERAILGTDFASASLFNPAAQVTQPLFLPQPLVNVWDAIADLCPPEAIESAADMAEASNSYNTLLRAPSSPITNHSARTHDQKMQRLMQIIREGQDLRVVQDPTLRPKSHYSQAYGRLHRRGLSRTITTYFCNPGSGRFLHPIQDRSITVREAARLQSFPDSFEFLGTQSEQMRLVGNAVPPLLAATLGRHVALSLQGCGS